MEPSKQKFNNILSIRGVKSKGPESNNAISRFFQHPEGSLNPAFDTEVKDIIYPGTNSAYYVDSEGRMVR
jgi:hypothetical protein